MTDPLDPIGEPPATESHFLRHLLQGLLMLLLVAAVIVVTLVVVTHRDLPPKHSTESSTA